MIYRNSYFKKELRQAYAESKISTNRKTALALFLGLLSFGLFFVLQTLKESVLAETLPQVMQPSFFSTVYLYIHLAFISGAVYFIFYYETLFFAEIRKNSWYLLIQMGYKPLPMFLAKFSALLYSVFFIYTVGYALTLLLTFLLKYTFIPAYLPVLYLVGLVDFFFITILCLTFSLFTKTIRNARYWTFLAAVLIVLLKIGLGEYAVIANRVLVQNLVNLLDPGQTVYLPVAGLLMAAGCLIGLVKSENLARYYNLPDQELPLPEGLEIVTVNPRTGRSKKLNKGAGRARGRKILNAVATALSLVLIGAALLFNLLVISINTATPGQEIVIGGIIPFVFQSQTMEPVIKKNDLAYFRKIDSQYPVEPGQIVLFSQDQVIYVERVTAQTEGGLRVDIDNYPPLAQPGAMLKTVPRQDVHGVYVGRSRWLGALILFANTIVGRLLFLLVPVILLFYSKQFRKLS
jgi:hypothetical protein